jgi:hypothetical protein
MAGTRFQLGTGRAVCNICALRIAKKDLDLVFHYYHGEIHNHWKCVVVKARGFINSEDSLYTSAALHEIQIEGERYI